MCCCLLCSKAINAAPAPPDVDIAAEAGKMKTRQRLRVLRVSSSGHWTNKNTREHIKSRAKSIQGEWLMLSDFCSCPWVLGSTFRSAFADWKCRPRCYDAGTGQGPKALALQVLENLEECLAFLHPLNQQAFVCYYDHIMCCCLLCSKAINAAPAPPDVDIAAEAGKMKTRQRLRVLRVSSSGHWTNKNTREHIKSRAKNIQGEWLMLSDFCSCPWVLGSTFRSAFADWKCRPRCYDAGTGQGPKALALQVLENLEECVAFLYPLHQ